MRSTKVDLAVEGGILRAPVEPDAFADTRFATPAGDAMAKLDR